MEKRIENGQGSPFGTNITMTMVTGILAMALALTSLNASNLEC